ncbi:MAG: hypothetical protein CM1200mP18_16160 [Gammaproteobacteria bacterium]|nr:MAG: hypothetical protein CM1200mP18_16160 [Gammaproteobacteria bacterium]
MNRWCRWPDNIEDVLEQIVGDIEDKHDVDEGAGMVLRVALTIVW